MNSLLRPHQIAPVQQLAHMLGSGQNAIDLSDTGTGKTYVAAAVANLLKRPTLAVVPLISVSQWHRAAAHFGDTISAVGYEALRTGRTLYGTWDNTPPPGFTCDRVLKCTMCQRALEPGDQGCYCHPAGIHCVETKKVPWDYGRFKFHPAIKQIIFDEAHRCGARDSLNADMMIAAKRQDIPTLALSATAACGPLELRALGYLLGLHNLGDFYQWSRRYGCGKIDGLKGWHWMEGKDKQHATMLRLRSMIIPERGVRVRVEDIPGFPMRTVTPELYDLVDKSKNIDTLYSEVREALENLKKRKENYVDPELAITKSSHAAQEIELLKVPLAVELARDYVAKGNSIGIFVNFTATIKELAKRLKTTCIIDGSADGVRNRGKSIDGFQSGKEKVILINSAAGGAAVSLPDEVGDAPRGGLVMPPRSARTLIQLLGRFHRESAKSPCWYKILLAAGTVEETMFRKIMVKHNNIEALNDGDLCPI